jgi:serine/threonine protein kinase
VLEAFSDALRREMAPWRLRVALARAAAEGLAALHGAELLHRDIKTENLLLDNGWRIKIADYGFAKKVADLKGGRAQPGTIVGTETFMAPEVIFGEAYGEHADVFSLGCVLAEVLTGRVPGVGGFLERTPRSKFAADLEQLRAAAPPDAPAATNTTTHAPAPAAARHSGDVRLGRHVAGSGVAVADPDDVFVLPRRGHAVAAARPAA